jgi:hypothetical protein
MVRYLELQPPGARRHTCTAGTTNASLLGLLDIPVHDREKQYRSFLCVSNQIDTKPSVSESALMNSNFA